MGKSSVTTREVAVSASVFDALHSELAAEVGALNRSCRMAAAKLDFDDPSFAHACRVSAMLERGDE